MRISGCVGKVDLQISPWDFDASGFWHSIWNWYERAHPHTSSCRWPKVPLCPRSQVPAGLPKAVSVHKGVATVVACKHVGRPVQAKGHLKPLYGCSSLRFTKPLRGPLTRVPQWPWGERRGGLRAQTGAVTSLMSHRTEQGGGGLSHYLDLPWSLGPLMID